MHSRYCTPEGGIDSEVGYDAYSKVVITLNPSMCLGYCFLKCWNTKNLKITTTFTFFNSHPHDAPNRRYPAITGILKMQGKMGCVTYKNWFNVIPW